MKRMLERFIKEEQGQGMAEYGLILALIAVVVAVAVSGLGERIRDVFDSITF